MPTLLYRERAELDAASMRRRLGERVKELRDARGLKQEDVVNLSGIQQSYISGIENGKVGIPSLERLFELSYVLGTNVNDLLMASEWPDVSEAVAELRELEAAVGALSGKRADIARRMLPLSDELLGELDGYLGWLEERNRKFRMPDRWPQENKPED